MTDPTERHAQKLASGRYLVTVDPPAQMQVEAGSVELSAEEYARYCDWLKSGGEPIQTFLPDLADDKRELLLSGWTPETWTEVFGGGPE
ncbi:MAG: hypothetical protein JWN07_3269 [Hyphomicrobiales bacterium]|nr:hypothetical protein [Hyphomicrobiales bacterium]